MSFKVTLDKVGKQFGEFTALRPFSENVEMGDRISILGHNGAGKSTLLNLIATLSRPSEGEIYYHMDGHELEKRPAIRQLMTYLSHEPMLYPDLTAEENLRFVAGMYNVPFDETRYKELLDMVGMSRIGDRLFRNCSRGMQQRLSIARAMLPNPKLLLLDEPFSGLDSEGIRRLKGLFLKPELSWVLVTHDLELGWELANRFWILRKGKLVHSLNKDKTTREEYLKFAREATLAGVMQ